MAYNPSYPECYITSNCYLICKGDNGEYELPGTPLSQEACLAKAAELASLSNGTGGNGTSKNSGGAGLLPWDLPTFGFSIDWQKLTDRLADLLGIRPDDLKLIAKALLIAGAFLIVLVLWSALKK